VRPIVSEIGRALLDMCPPAELPAARRVA
jgi:hypothetical protein